MQHLRDLGSKPLALKGCPEQLREGYGLAGALLWRQGNGGGTAWKLARSAKPRKQPVLSLGSASYESLSSIKPKENTLCLANVGDMWEGKRIHLEFREERKKSR